MVARSCLGASLLLAVKTAPAQQALQNSLAGDAAAEARRAMLSSQQYTLKTGDLKLLVTPSFNLSWNDNINVSQTSPQEDVILEPMLLLRASYPLTQDNWVTLRAGAGYDEYLEHSQYSGPRLLSGSELSFDFYVKDFWINLHDRSSFTEDSGGVAAVAGSGPHGGPNGGLYGGLNNTVGPTVTWDLRAVVLTLGYDHQNYLASSSQFDSQNHASELMLARAGLRLNPVLTTGLEGTGSLTEYDEKYLNDNQAYSLGGYADWRPGSHFQVQARAGYTVSLFEQTSQATQTSQAIRATDVDSWYARLTLSHAVTEALTYSLSAGHELLPGITADTITDTYVRPSATWNLIKDVKLTGNVSYQDGQQGNSGQGGGIAEHFDWFTAGVGVSYSPTKRFTTSLNYRLTLRSSNAADRSYTQDMVGLLITYNLPHESH